MKNVALLWKPRTLIFPINVLDCCFALKKLRVLLFMRGADKSLARPGRKQLQRLNSGFIQHTLHEAQYTS